MITILQVDKNFSNNPNYVFLIKNMNFMNKNKNNFKLFVDDDNFISYSNLKIVKLLDILKKYSDDEIIMYIDAFDTLVVSDDNEIERKFIESQADVIYSIENGVWPDPNFSKFYDNKYVNSGTIIFKNKKYQQILEILKIMYEGRLIYNCDQYYHTIFCTIKLQEINLKLDTNNDFFQCLWCDDNDINFINKFNNINDRVMNTETNTFPCVFHGNGIKGKENLNKLFYLNDIDIHFCGFTNDRLGINFMNVSTVDKYCKVKAEIKNKNNQIVYSTFLNLVPNISYFIQTNIKDDYFFTIYDVNDDILLQKTNF